MIFRIAGSPDRRIEREERDHLGPCLTPGRGDGGVFSGPVFLELVQFSGGLIGGGGLINLAQISGHIFAIIPSAEVQGMAQQMHNAGLDGGIWEGLRDRIREAFEAIHYDNQDTLDPRFATKMGRIRGWKHLLQTRDHLAG